MNDLIAELFRRLRSPDQQKPSMVAAARQGSTTPGIDYFQGNNPGPDPELNMLYDDIRGAGPEQHEGTETEGQTDMKDNPSPDDPMAGIYDEAMTLMDQGKSEDEIREHLRGQGLEDDIIDEVLSVLRGDHIDEEEAKSVSTEDELNMVNNHMMKNPQPQVR